MWSLFQLLRLKLLSPTLLPLYLNKKCHMELDISNAELCGKFFPAELNIPNVKFYAKNFKKLK